MLVYCDSGNIEDANTGETVAMQITENLNIMTLLTCYITVSSGYLDSVEG